MTADSVLYAMGKVGKKGQPERKYRRTHLKEWREHRGMTIEELANAVETSDATISRLENGKQPYTQALFERLARALHCTPSDLIDRTPTEAESLGSLFAGMSEASREYTLTVMKSLRDKDRPQ